LAKLAFNKHYSAFYNTELKAIFEIKEKKVYRVKPTDFKLEKEL